MDNSIHKRCRLCIAESKISLHLFEPEAIRINLVDKIRAYLCIIVMMDDGLPQQICYECLSRIEMFHSYKQSCLESQHTLKHWNVFYGNEGIPQEAEAFTGRNRSQEMQVLDPFRNRQSPSSKTNMLTNLTDQQSSSQGMKRSLSSLSLTTNKIEVSPPKPSLPQQTSPNVTNQSKARSRETNVAEGKRPRPSPESRSPSPDSRSPSPESRSPSPVSRSPSPESRSPSPEPEPRKLRPRSPSPHPRSRKETGTKSVQSQNDSRDNKRTPKKSSEQASTEIETDSQSSLMPKIVEVYSQNTNKKKGRPKKVFTPVSFEVIPPKSPQIASKEVSNNRTSSPKKFAPTISESVKQRKRSSSVSSQSTPRKNKRRSKSNENTPPQSSPTIIPTSDESSDLFAGFGAENLTDTPTPEKQNSNAKEGSGGKQVKTIQELLKILQDEDADNDDNDMDTDVDSVDYRSDIQGSDGECSESDVTKRPSTPGPKNPRAAFVKVKKLPSDGQVFDPESGGIPPSRIGRPRSQNNYYRFVKTVICEETGKEKYQCLQCSKLISYRTYVKEHMMIHSGERPEKCDVCAKSFRNKQILKIHKNTHVQNREYKCEDCGHIFPQYIMLRQHMKQHFPLNYDCKVCGKKCSQQSVLTLHMRKHTGEKPFKCEHCGNCFKDRTTWANHVRIHTGERPYECPECKKTYTRQSTMILHRKSHMNVRPFACLICLNRFKMKAALVKHLHSVHKDIYKSAMNVAAAAKCQECGKTFGRLANLRAHKINIHSNERPFKCPLCNKAFKMKAHLEKHLACIHKELLKSMASFVKPDLQS